jgi:uncharacterized protein YndB with AHSA1/START domain
MKVIKREMVIEAPVSKVWKHLTDPEKIAGWLMPNDFEATVGREFFLECPQEGKIACVVKEVVPNEKLVYSFQSNTPRADTLVTLTLAREGKATRVTLVHTGWDALPPAEQGQADNYGSGWGSGLEKLRLQVRGI